MRRKQLQHARQPLCKGFDPGTSTVQTNRRAQSIEWFSDLFPQPPESVTEAGPTG